MGYIENLIVLAALFAALAVTLNLLMGTGGLFSVAHALFFGLGAYSSSILTVTAGWPWVATLPLAVGVAALVSLLIALVSLRVSEDYLIIGSFGLQIIGTNVLLNWRGLTGGPVGVSGIPLPQLFGWHIVSGPDFVLLAGATLAVTALVVGSLQLSPFGRGLRAIRDDETAARACGKAAVAFKVQAFLIAGALAGLAGAVYASYIGFVSPEQFTIELSILFLAMIIVGGVGTIRGAIAGAVLLLAVPEILRALSLPRDLIGPGQQVLYGLTLIAFALLRPQGLFPDRSSSVAVGE